MKLFTPLLCLCALLGWAMPVRGRAASSAPASEAQPAHSFTIGQGTFLLDGAPFVIKAAEVHYPRIPRPYWEHRIKMCKALGMNTLCLYVFWNIHEQHEGQFDFTEGNDLRHFIQLAQQNGMYVILRPGPYVCAEWEMGGLPWWLLKKKDIRLREQDPYFMERLNIFERKVAEQVSDLTIERGGPIIMVQVENEYGSYGEDKAYVSAVRDALRAAGWDKVELFQCDWSSNFTKNGLDDLTWTMNFGTGANIDQEFKRLGQLRPQSPKMCSEFWSGWFDKWGGRHETRGAEAMVDGITQMLDRGISFSLYMTHGGTNWGHWAGANSPGFAPDVTSYDYDAPINEAGQATPKYWTLRSALERYSGTYDPQSGQWTGRAKLPAVPRAMPTVAIPAFTLTRFAPLLAGCDSVARSAAPLTFEEMNMGWGSMVYAAPTPEVPVQSVLRVDAHDYAQVYVDGRYVGQVDRVKHETTLTLPPLREGQQLAILVEGMGRINFGRAIKDYKGIIGDVSLTAEVGTSEVTWRPRQWTVGRIADDYATAGRALAGGPTADADAASLGTASGPVSAGLLPAATADGQGGAGIPGYYSGTFRLTRTGDTFLNLGHWGKGQVYVNGHAVGRHWYIGPQQTLYVPGCWLRKGVNEVVVLDVMGPRGPLTIEGLAEPVIDRLNLDRPQTHRLKGEQLDLAGERPVAEGEFQAGNGWQEVHFDSPATGRYVCIEALDSHQGREYACIAEWYMLGADGRRLSREPWQVDYCDDEDIKTGNKTADKIFDLQESTYWSTNRGVPFPHHLIIDLGQDQTFTGFQYLPRVEAGAPESIRHYRIYVKSEPFRK